MNKEIILMIGIPGSGKTTYVNNVLPREYSIICRDDIRLACGVKFDVKIEPYVFTVSKIMGSAFIERKKSFILDETNTRIDNIEYWVHLAKENNYKIIAYLMNTPLEICKERRNLDIPYEVIHRMDNQLKNSIVEITSIVDEMITINYEGDRNVIHSGL